MTRPTIAPPPYEDYRDLEVIERVEEADGVITLRLADPQGAALPAWAPGSHVDLRLGNGMERQYSLCSRFEADTWRIAILWETHGRGGSAWVHEHLDLGSLIATRGPRNHFPLVDAPDYLFIGGGIGVTPLIPMLGEVIQTKDAPWRFYYGGRTRASMAFRDRLEPLGAVIWPEDEKGLLPLADMLADVSVDTAIYCCGPEPLLAAVESACAERGLPAPHVERFSPKPIDDSADAGDHPFTVVVASTGAEYAIPAERSIAEVLQEAGVPLMTSCAEGVCGTCETKVIEGEIVHRDSLLTEDDRAEGVYMMPCVSRCAGDRLVLDL
jgi:ferredoxin-NADP reductase